MTIRIRRVDSSRPEIITDLLSLDALCLPHDVVPFLPNYQWWIAYDLDVPVAYAAARFWPPDTAVYLARAGVIPSHRGQGLQKRLIRTREKWGVDVHGATESYTYAVPSNAPSLNSLIALGYRVWLPTRDTRDTWGGDDVVYLARKLVK